MVTHRNGVVWPCGAPSPDDRGRTPPLPSARGLFCPFLISSHSMEIKIANKKKTSFYMLKQCIYSTIMNYFLLSVCNVDNI